MIRVILIFDRLELGVVAAVESVLPVGLLEVGLVHVRATARSDLFNLGHKDLGHLLLGSLHIDPRSGAIPVGDELKLRDGAAPRGQDGIVGSVGTLGVVGGGTGEKNTLLCELGKDFVQLGSIVLDDVTGNQATAELVAVDLKATFGERAEVAVVVVVV